MFQSTLDDLNPHKKRRNFQKWKAFKEKTLKQDQKPILKRLEEIIKRLEEIETKICN